MATPQLDLNRRAMAIAQQICREPQRYCVDLHNVAGATLVDAGLERSGGHAVGLCLAEICLAGLANVSLGRQTIDEHAFPTVLVQTDHAVAACMASQYAGWRIAEVKFFAMGSGPMRAAYGHEKLFDSIGFRERSDVAVGVIESSQLPPESVVLDIANKCAVPPDHLVLLIAPTASIAGGVQIVARSVETALHKLHELGFDLTRIVSAQGSAPLPPVAKNDIAAIGRTNDAVLYGGNVSLWVQGDDESLTTIGPQVPSSASKDYGEPFQKIFERYRGDFYKIDPHLFSPARITFHNVKSGKTFSFGEMAPEIILKSFLSS